MVKDYKKWHTKKSLIETGNDRLYFHEREIWWCSLGHNVGFEQDGKGVDFARPILVFKKFNKEVFWGIPLSTKIKKGIFYHTINAQDGVERSAILSQLRLIDAKRLIDKVSVVSESEYSEIQKAIICLCK